jgi:hypothetical protein
VEITEIPTECGLVEAPRSRTARSPRREAAARRRPPANGEREKVCSTQCHLVFPMCGNAPGIAGQALGQALSLRRPRSESEEARQEVKPENLNIPPMFLNWKLLHR